MSRTITSSQISFIDTTDSRKLDLYISSNLPTIQIKNSNTGVFSPDYNNNPLILQATAYIENQDVSSSATYVWYLKYGTGTEIQISTGKNLTINTNLTDTSGIATYRCVAAYQGLSATDSIVFSRTETGLNGNDGSPAAPVRAQYSSDGVNWNNVLQGDSKYIRFSYDNALTWTSAIKIKGEDGSGVAIKGTAYTTESTLTAGMTISILYSNPEKTLDINKNYLDDGDSYIVDGYLCVFDKSADNFVCAGTIQGPQGNPGISSYTFIRYADSERGANMSISPVNKTYIGIAVTSNSSAPTSASSYTWSRYVGEDAKSIHLSTSSQVFKVSANGVIIPNTIVVTGTSINTEISAWQYSTDGGVNFVSTLPNGVERSGNQITITGASITSNSITIRATDGTYFDTLTVFKVADGADGEPGDTGDPASLAFLTNEHINFVANPKGQVAGQTVIINVVAYTGVTKVIPTLGNITGLPDGMSINTSDIVTISNEKVIPIVISDDTNFGSENSNNGVINIPITSPVSTNLKLSWSKVNTGNDGENAVSFQIYAPYGRLLSEDLPSLTLDTFAYDGATEITDAIYQWYKLTDDGWESIIDATEESYMVMRGDVLNSQAYKCDMTYKGITYSDTETVEDTSDIYDALLCTVNSDIIGDNARFIIAYALVYNNKGEADALLGPISAIEPTEAKDGDYWYSINESLETVTLKKYNGTIWEASTDEQAFTYDWNIGGVGKVKIIKKSDISIATNVQCDVISQELGIVARCGQVLYDSNDPTVSSDEPTIKYDGQIWIKTYDNGTFSMYTWSSELNKWIKSESDDRQKIFTSKPSNYRVGDLWLVGVDYIPAGFAEGALLKAKDSNLTYADANWVDQTAYAKQIADLEESVGRYNQFFEFTAENGLQIRAKDANNNPSKFYTQLTNTELGFYQDNDKVAYINDHKMHITEADINRVSTPMLQIGSFSFVTESNGSMSIIINN